MPLNSDEFRRTLPALSAAIPIAIIFVAVLSIVLTAAEALNLSEGQTSGWISVVYGLPAIPSIILTWRYRQPLLLTGNVFAVIFIASLGDRVRFAELAGASFLAGAIVLVAGTFGLTRRLATWIPAPIVHGLIAGAVTPFVINVFSSLSTSAGGETIPPEVPAMVAGVILGFFLSQRFLGSRLPPIFPALVVGLVVAAATGQFGPVPSTFSLPDLTPGWPEFSWSAVATATPVLVAVIVLQANLPSLIFIRSQGYRPPEGPINVVSGIGTMLGSFIGPLAVSLALPLVPLTAGPAAGEFRLRHRSIYIPAGVLLLITLLAGTAADLAALVPVPLLLTLAGLALVGVLVGALKEITRGPLILGPIFAFVIALSDISLLGLGPFFWSLVLGTLISMLVERDEWKALRADVGGSSGGPPDDQN